MDIVFLGTSSGTPTKQRNVTGLALLAGNARSWYLIDCGEGTQHQLLHTPMSMMGLRAIFITHVHGDHCYGLPGLLASAAMSGRKDPLTIIAPEGVATWINATQQQTALHLPFKLDFIPVETLDAWNDETIVVEVARLSHRVPSYAYSFTEAKRDASLDVDKLIRDGVPRGICWGKLKKGEDVNCDGVNLKSVDYLYYPYKARKIVVGGDNDCPELLSEKCKEADVLVHEATYTRDVAARLGNSFQHSSAASVAAFAESIGLPNLVLTHFSPRYQSNAGQSPSIEDIRTEAAAIYHGQLFLAEDFGRYELSKSGQFTKVMTK